MEEIIKEVLLKKVGNRKHDQVLIVENLPSKFLYELTAKMIPRKDRDGWMDGTMSVDPSGEKVFTLLPGIEKSQTGDGGFVFNMGDQESENRLKDIMRFVEMTFPRDQRLPEFIDNAQMRGETNSGPIPYSNIPRISLPVVEKISPAPAPALSTYPQVSSQEPSGTLKIGKRAPLSSERKEQLRANLAKAREARKAKVSVA